MRLPLLCLFVALLLGSARAAEPFFKKNDVIALVGGEDMVVASEYGYLELLLTRALPDYHLRFRNLAKEGDTVYEQPRDLNFPTWEESLDKIGATVVICQFGQMESLDGKEKIPEFTAAYKKLLERFSNGGKRRILVLSPYYFSQSTSLNPEDTERLHQAEFLKSHDESASLYAHAIEQITRELNLRCVDNLDLGMDDAVLQRDGIHLTEIGHQAMIFGTMLQLQLRMQTEKETPENTAQLLKLIVAKNKLWFNYWRVENWAFLFGDRTNQPSSRDHLDPSKRWFPAEREEFLPLIEAKEKEIDALAEKLAGK
jgi:hypothetical protein